MSPPSNSTITSNATVVPALYSSAVTSSTQNNIYNDFSVSQKDIYSLMFGGIFCIAISVAFIFPLIINFFSKDKKSSIVWVRKSFGYIFLVAGLVLLCSAAYMNSSASRISLVYSPRALLASIWSSYNENYVSTSTARTIDPSKGDITTSEGESYTMLRAVWLDDQSTFDASWKWSEANLSRPNDHLFSWLYGERPDGSEGILTDQGGNNTASDADTDIALSLVFAYSRWQQPQYLASARQIISDIWDQEVVVINGKPYLAADNLEKNSKLPTIVVDPSYFSPYAYRIFATIDPTHPWMELVDNSYAVIYASMDSPLDATSSAELPPDWVLINKTTGAITPTTTTSTDSNYGYDAMRLPWRLALDWEWYKDPRDQQILDKMSFLKQQWDTKGALDAVYGHNGSVVAHYEDSAIYGGDMGYFIVSDPQDAAAVYQQKLLVLYDPGSDDWKVPLGYYDSNWVWFGMALYNKQLPNLAASIPYSTQP